MPEVVRLDNLKAGVARACLYDPDVSELYAAFAKHWGFVPLPSRPRHPQEQGINERGNSYLKDNALKGRRFDSLEDLDIFLKRWNRTIARVRIHGTTRKQVYTHFLEVEKPALKLVPEERFSLFEVGTRTVHPDGHVEVARAFYSVPDRLVGEEVRARWNERLRVSTITVSAWVSTPGRPLVLSLPGTSIGPPTSRPDRRPIRPIC